MDLTFHTEMQSVSIFNVCSNVFIKKNKKCLCLTDDLIVPLLVVLDANFTDYVTRDMSDHSHFVFHRER